MLVEYNRNNYSHYQDSWTEDEQRYVDEVLLKNIDWNQYLDENGIKVREDKEDEFDIACRNARNKEMKFFFLSGKYTKRMKGYSTEYLQNYSNNIICSYHFCNNVFFTPNSFKIGSQRPLQNQLYNIYCLALDIDYKDHSDYNRNASPMDFFWNVIASVCGSVIPIPSYVEYGHQLRLIYVLNEQIQAKNRKLIQTTKTVLRRLSDALNEELACGCEPQKLTSYFRLPCSTNTKDSSTVHVVAVSDERYTLQEIMDEYLPALPDWYGTWVSNKKDKKIIRLHNHYTMWKNRIDAILEVQGEENINRENTCFLYAQYIMWTQSDKSDEEIMNIILEFNKNFAKPLKEKEIKSALGAMLKTRKLYKFKNSTLSEFVGIELNIQKSNARAEEREARIKNGAMRWQKTEAKIKQIKELKAQGKTNKEIAKIMQLSVRQIQKLNKKEV